MSRLTLLRLASVVVALCACDRQVDTHFQGDSLLRIEGNVIIPQDQGGADYVPALVFEAVQPQNVQPCCNRTFYDHQRVVDVGVRGEFPSNFTLDVFDPPPAEAIQEMTPGEPAYAIGYVTAVHAEHPDALTMQPRHNAAFEADLERWTEIWTARCGDEQGACQVHETCTLDRESCLIRTLECRADLLGSTDQACAIVGSEGDEKLGLAGYSLDYRILYFSAPVAADTLLAARISGGKPISAGYHLYRRLPTPSPPADIAAHLECFMAASPIAVDRYNMEHGTSFTYEHLGDPHNEVNNEFERLHLRVAREHGCQMAPPRYEEVAGAPVAIVLGAPDPSTPW